MSTPISQLRSEGDNSQTVDGILSQLEQEGQQMPPQQMQQQMPPQQMPPQQMSQQQMPQQMQEDGDEYEEFDDYYDDIQERQLSPTEHIISEFKLPLLVAFLVFLTNFGMVNELIMKNIPRLANDGELNLIGLVAKALVAGAVFYLVRRFLL